MVNSFFIDATGSMSDEQIESALEKYTSLQKLGDYAIVFNEFQFIRTLNTLFAGAIARDRVRIDGRYAPQGARYFNWLNRTLELTKKTNRILITDGYIHDELLKKFNQVIRV